MRILIAVLVLPLIALPQNRDSSPSRDREGAGAILDRVAVVVGNTVLTETEVLQEARLEAFLNQTPLDLDPAARRAAAERLVDQQLIRNEMRIGAYPEPSAAEIDDMLANLKRERFRSDADYRAALTRYALTEETLRRHLAWQLSAIRFTDLRFSPAVAGIPDTDGHSANRASANAADIDQQLDAWLKQARAATKVQFKPGAFQ
jgi:hypothetical protein